MKDYEVIKIGKNQVTLDPNNGYVVEKYEFTENGVDMFSVIDSYDSLEKAVKVAEKIK